VCVRGHAGRAEAIARRTWAVRLLAAGLTFEGLTPGPASGSPTASPPPWSSFTGSLRGGLPGFAGTIYREHGTVTHGHEQAFASSGQSGPDPLLSQLLRRFGFCSFLVMIALYSGSGSMRRERRGVRMSVVVFCHVESSRLFRSCWDRGDPVGSAQAGPWGNGPSGFTDSELLDGFLVICPDSRPGPCRHMSWDGSRRPRAARASRRRTLQHSGLCSQSRPRDGLHQLGSKSTRPDVTRGLRPSEPGLPVTRRKRGL